MNYKPYKHLPPFKGMVLQNFPFIEEDFDAITNYQLLCKVVEYLKNVIANELIMEENVNSLYNAFIELKTFVDNYFKNLDVQEEINNKLDEMVEDGTLQEIIGEFLNSNALWCFDTIEDMKNADNLIDGSYAKTLGFYEVNDGGSSLYYITDEDIEADNIFTFQLNNNLIAHLITKDKMYSMQFGINKETNITEKLNKILQKYKNDNLELIFNENEYNINGNIKLYSNTKLNFNNSTFILDAITIFLNNDDNEFNYASEIKNITLENGNFVSQDTIKIFKIAILKGKNIIIRNNTIDNCINEGSHLIEISGCNNVDIINNNFINGTNVAENPRGEIINLDPAVYNATPYWNELSPLYDNTCNSNINIIGNNFKQNNINNVRFNHIGTHLFNNVSNYHNNIVIKNNIFDVPERFSIRPIMWENVLIENNTFNLDNNEYEEDTPLRYFISVWRTSSEIQPNVIIYGANKNIKIINNIMKKNNNTINDRVGFIEIGANANIQNENILIDNNIFEGSKIDSNNRGSNAIRIYYANNCIISNNIIKKSRNAISGEHDNLFNINNNIIIDSERYDNISESTNIFWNNNINNNDNVYSIIDTNKFNYFNQSSQFDIESDNTYQTTAFNSYIINNSNFSYDSETNKITYIGETKSFKVSFSAEFISRSESTKYIRIIQNNSPKVIRSISASSSMRFDMSGYGYVELNNGDTLELQVYGIANDSINTINLEII